MCCSHLEFTMCLTQIEFKKNLFCSVKMSDQNSWLSQTTQIFINTKGMDEHLWNTVTYLGFHGHFVFDH